MKRKRSAKRKDTQFVFLISAVQAVIMLSVSAVLFVSVCFFENTELKDDLKRFVRENAGESLSSEASQFKDILGNGFFSKNGREPLPMDGKITSSFGKRVNPILKTQEFHRGLDISASEGEAVGAVFPGKCVDVGENPVDGIYVILKHGNFNSKYCHLVSTPLTENLFLREGETVGYAGHTGLATGPHLHLEIIKDGGYINPESAFKSPGEAEYEA